MRALIPGLRGSRAQQDPAPSRLKYRIQRWMLTPGIRMGLKFGLPLCLSAAAAAAFLASEPRRDALQVFVNDLRASIEQRPEFMVNDLANDRAGDTVSADIREQVPLDFPVSSFDLDVAQIRDAISGLDPVKSAEVRIRPGGVLQVDVTEREPAVVWRSHEGLALLDDTGTHVAELGRRSLRRDLPLIAGEGADAHVDEALALIAAAAPLKGRVRGLQRMGERRWDVVLDRGQRIQLPSESPLAALEQVLAISEVKDLLERDVAVVDMRLAARPTIRMSENAVQDWWRIRQINGNGQ